MFVEALEPLFSPFSVSFVLVLPLPSWLSLIHHHQHEILLCYQSLMINLCVFLVLYPPNFPDLCLCARNPTLSKFLSWDLHLPAYFCVCLLFALFWGVPLIDITCVFLCILIFLSSHAFTVSFGLCQHLPSGENSLQVAVCVCVLKN